VEKELFAKLYEKVVGKAFSTKTTIVSDANLEKMQTFADKLPKELSSKPAPKKEEKDDKVLKSDEIGFGGGGFLSGLGFGKQEEKAEEKIDLDEFFGKNEPVTTSKVDIFDIASRSTNERRENATNREHTGNRPSTSNRPHGPSSNGGPNRSQGQGQGKPRKTGGNVTIEQGTYVAKEKGVSSSDIFDAARAKGSSTQAPHNTNRPGGQGGHAPQ
jgi:hypothetical protein